MKKALIIIIAIIILVIGVLVVVPIFFKQNLLVVAKNTLNKQINAEVEFADLKLSLFRNFPQATVEFQDVMIKGKGEFQKDTLLYVTYVRAKMDLSSLFNKSEMSIEEIILEKPRMNMIVAESGNVNWDVAPEQSTSSSESDNSSSGADEFQLQLEKIEIRNADFIYDDKLAKQLTELRDINFDINGSMYGNSTQLDVKGDIKELNFQQNKVNYISKSSLNVSSLLHVDFDKMKYTIAENELILNRLPLQLSGSVEIPSDTTFIDIQLVTNESDFENFIALVPPVYEEYLKDIKTDGSATISGTISGFYIDEDYPALNLNMMVSEGNLHYADMPEQIKNIKADIRVLKPQGDLDLTEIKIKEAHAEIRNNPVDLTLSIANPVSDPFFDGAFIGKINLKHLKNALPIDSVNIAGIIDANLFVKGNYSDVEAEAYDKIKSDGVVLLDNFVYDSPQLTQQIVVTQGRLDFSPKSIYLRQFNLKVGQSDFRLSGNVSDYLNYLLKDGILTGNLQLNSRMVNLNELLRLQVKSGGEVAENQQKKPEGSGTDEVDDTVLAFDIPEKIDISFNSNIDNAVLNRIPISGIKGSIRAFDKKLLLNDLSMNMLDGELKMNGSYQNSPQNQPLFDFGFNISNFDIPTMYQTMAGVRSLMPVSGNSKGKISTNLGMKGRLSEQLKLIPSTANGKGMLTTQGLEIKDSPIFNQLSGIIKKEKLKNVTINDFIANFTVENGNLLLKPFKTKVIGQETNVAGSLNVESILNMRLDFNVERDAFGPDIQKILAVIPGNEKIEMLPAGVLINGPVGEPKVNLDLSATQKAVTDATKDDIKKSLENLGKGLKKLFK
jgi:uncharacterized protein involved in outer membrane biogenesis